MQHNWAERCVLVVDPLGTLAAELGRATDDAVRFVSCPDFPAARRALLREQPAVLITDLRLGAYNGLHLAYLAGMSGVGTSTIVFADPMDSGLAHEAQKIGAFVEWRHRAPYAINSYLAADLPGRDRRAILWYDRRHTFRGGRRAADVRAAFDPTPSTAPQRLRRHARESSDE